MKKSRLALFVATALSAILALALCACGSSSTPAATTTAQTESDKTITVGASPSPHAEILSQVSDALAEKGYTLNVVEYSDYIQPNVALSEGELDANYFQHQPYLDEYNEENKTDLVGAGAIHFEPLSLYAGKTAKLSDIADGAQIAVPSDTTNEARALQLLQAQGIIKLADGVGLTATANDIVDNPHNVKIVEAEAAAVARTLPDVDFAVINGNYALSAGIDTEAALAREDASSEAAQTYANIVAVRSGDENSAKTDALVEALTSAQVKSYIDSTYKGAVVAVF